MSPALVLGAERPVAGYMGPTSPTSPTAVGALGRSEPQLQFADELHERTQALYRRFGISGRHPPEPPGPSERKPLYQRFGISGEHPPEPPGPANASFISKIWHVRGTLP